MNGCNNEDWETKYENKQNKNGRQKRKNSEQNSVRIRLRLEQFYFLIKQANLLSAHILREASLQEQA